MAIYNVLVKPNSVFTINGLNTINGINKQIYELVVKYTDGKCKIQYDTENRKSFVDLTTGKTHSFNGTQYDFSHMFDQNELDSFEPADTITDSDLLEFMLSYYKVDRNEVSIKFNNRKVILEEIKKLEEELDAIKL